MQVNDRRANDRRAPARTADGDAVASAFRAAYARLARLGRESLAAKRKASERTATTNPPPNPAHAHRAS